MFPVKAAATASHGVTTIAAEVAKASRRHQFGVLCADSRRYNQFLLRSVPGPAGILVSPKICHHHGAERRAVTTRHFPKIISQHLFLWLRVDERTPSLVVCAARPIGALLL